jgi:DNA-binding GntR family transcriptional regulator
LLCALNLLPPTTGYNLPVRWQNAQGPAVTSDTVTDVPDLDHDSPVPLWEQLAGRLRDDITSGRLTGRVPSATALAMSYGVSRDTALRALAQLASEGLTVARRGRGTFVVPDREH